MKKRVHCFIDGFNILHAIKELKEPDLEWVNYRKLCEQFINPLTHEIITVFYFSAYPTWLPEVYAQHMKFIKLLNELQVTTIMGRFKKKAKYCSACGFVHQEREEKETDVNIAVALIKGAMLDEYDEAFLFSSDSDLSPALRFIKCEFPHKKIKLIAALSRKHSNEMLNATGREGHATIKREHLVSSLIHHN